jgi:hypothetical protein
LPSGIMGLRKRRKSRSAEQLLKRDAGVKTIGET